MKIRKQSEALKIAVALEAQGYTVEWIRKNYGAQRERTWNIRLSDGSEIHHMGDIGPMADRTLGQVTKEIDQVATEVTSLEAQIQSRREKLTELVREQVRIQADTLSHFGLRLVIENARDGLPFEGSRRRRSAVSVTTDRNLSKTIRAWAADQGMTVPSRGAIPKEIHEAYEKAHPSG